MSKSEEKPRADIYARITDRIVAELERGVRPWMQPWRLGSGNGSVTRPLRHNGLPYSGMNVLLLWSEAAARGFSSPVWMTFKQALELGGAVRKGESGSMVVFASRFKKTETDAAGDMIDREVPFLKSYTVFNAEQIDGLPANDRNSEPACDPIERIDHADRFFAATGAVLRHGGDRAYYSPLTDHIQMPHFATFRDGASYVATLSHEATHWTAASHRVNRDLSRYGKVRSERAREELNLEAASSAPISASRRSWSRVQITPAISPPGSRFCRTTSASSFQPRRMHSGPLPIFTGFSRRLARSRRLHEQSSSMMPEPVRNQRKGLPPSVSRLFSRACVHCVLDGHV